MRTLKSATQRNCRIANEFYTESGMRVLVDSEPAIFTLPSCLGYPKDYRVDLTMCKTISVIYDKTYECYVNVVVTEAGNTIYVDL